MEDLVQGDQGPWALPASLKTSSFYAPTIASIGDLHDELLKGGTPPIFPSMRIASICVGLSEQSSPGHTKFASSFIVNKAKAGRAIAAELNAYLLRRLMNELSDRRASCKLEY